MVRIGNRNRLVILRDSDFGQVLDGGKGAGEILLPARYVDPEIEPGDEIDVFVYCDSEDRVVATTETPLAEVGDFAALVVKDVTRVGAFLDWGLSKDLLLPHSEQKGKPRAGQRVVVRVAFDEVSSRIVATQKLKPAPGVEPAGYRRNEKVEALIASRSDLGWTAIVDGEHLGLLYHNEIFEEVREGDTVTAYVKEVRPQDGRIDLSLQPQGHSQVSRIEARILGALRKGDGFVPIHDKSSPDEIQAALGTSKKTFKKAIGALYRKGVIAIEETGIRLLGERDGTTSDDG